MMDHMELLKNYHQLASDMIGEDANIPKRKHDNSMYKCKYCSKWSFYESLVLAHEEYDHEW